MSKGTRITKRWIDADGIMRACYNSFLTTGNKAYSEIIALVEAVPAADVAEVRKGRWIYRQLPMPLSDGSKECVECSVCHTHWDGEMNYCPNCGAKMVNEDD